MAKQFVKIYTKSNYRNLNRKVLEVFEINGRRVTCYVTTAHCPEVKEYAGGHAVNLTYLETYHYTKAETDALVSGLDTRLTTAEAAITALQTTRAKIATFSIVGNGVASVFTITHGLNLANKHYFQLSLYEETTGLEYGVCPEADSVNACSIDFGEVLADGKTFTGIIVGKGA